MKVYLAGGMRGYPHFNFPLFAEATEALRSRGYDVVSPAEIDEATGVVEVTRGWDESIIRVTLTPLFSIENALLRDFTAILQSDGVVFLPDWENSEGAVSEYFVAVSTGKKLFRYDPNTELVQAFVPQDYIVTLTVLENQYSTPNPIPSNEDN